MTVSRHLILTITALCAASFCFSQIPKYNSNSSASATAYLDFDGQTVKGTAWNWDETIVAKPAGLSNTIITEIFNRVAEDFRIFNLNITTDVDVFRRAPIAKRMRVIVTPSMSWYGTAAGVSFVNSFTWGDDTPAWVFTPLLENKPKYLAEAASHEIGHTLGLQHQSTYSRTCELLKEYAEGKGTGEIGWAPIMGVGYYKNLTVWTIGTSVEGCNVVQNDINIISKGLSNIGLRADEHGNTRATATNILLTNNNFAVNGIINNAADRDLFKIVIPRRMKLKAKITPNNVGANNSGANVDLYLTLLKFSGDTIGRYNPKTLLNASIDTSLASGTYFLSADGIGNQNVSDYGSVGLYALTGTLENLVATATVLIRGDARDNYNVIKWESDSSTTLRGRTVEYSLDGENYSVINDIPISATSFAHRAPQSDRVYYRLRTTYEDLNTDYSNVVSITGNENAKVSVVANLIKTHAVVQSSGEYQYQLFDAGGRLLGRGVIQPGNTRVPVNTVNAGVFVLKVFGKSEQYQFRLIKQ